MVAGEGSEIYLQSSKAIYAARISVCLLMTSGVRCGIAPLEVTPTKVGVSRGVRLAATRRPTLAARPCSRAGCMTLNDISSLFIAGALMFSFA